MGCFLYESDSIKTGLNLTKPTEASKLTKKLQIKIKSTRIIKTSVQRVGGIEEQLHDLIALLKDVNGVKHLVIGARSCACKLSLRVKNGLILVAELT